MGTSIQNPPAPKRARKTLVDRERGLISRSRRIPLTLAKNFAKAQAARGVFAFVEVRGVKTDPEGDRTAYVCWQPANPDCQQRIADAFTRDRLQRAILQADEFTFWPVEERPGWHWCIHDYGNDKPCGVYVVHPVFGCDIEGHGCPDMLWRGSKISKKCKHYFALRRLLGLPVEGSAAAPPVPPAGGGVGGPVETVAERRARLAKDRLRDFA